LTTTTPTTPKKRDEGRSPMGCNHPYIYLGISILSPQRPSEKKKGQEKKRKEKKKILKEEGPGDKGK